MPIVVFTVLLRKHLLRGITFGAVRQMSVRRIGDDRRERARPRWRDPAPRAAGRTWRRSLIAAGVVMLMQPFSLTLYTYSFVTMLAGTVMFIIVTKFPD